MQGHAAEDGRYDKFLETRLHVVWDQGFRVLRWSHWAQNIFGWSEEEVLGKRPGDWTFIHGDDREEVGRAMDRLASGEVKRQTVRWRHLTRDGHPVTCDWFHYARIPIADEGIVIESLVRPVAMKS